MTAERVVYGNHELLVEYCYSAGRPGKFYGPWENCYPDEDDEVEVCQVYLVRKGRTRILPDDGKWTARLYEQILEIEAGRRMDRLSEREEP